MPTWGTMAPMDEIPTAGQLRTAARACLILAYAAGLAGVAAGTLVLRDGELAFAVILWVITFAIGASLMGVSLLIRALAGLTARVEQTSSDVRVLVGERARHRQGDPDRDPWLGHPPY
jgi:quinol-cytochrome oxidoreductase complex cytochrome b subunit